VDGTFEEYVNSRGTALLRFAYVLCGDRYLAEDLVQEALARVHRRWNRLPYLEQPDAYVRTAIVRQYLSWRRRRSSREAPLAVVPEAAAAAGSDVAASHAARDEMWRLLAGLPRRQRTVLVLRYYQDLPDDEIAEALGCAPATVRVHAARGLSRLRVALGPRAGTGLTAVAEPHPVGGES